MGRPAEAARGRRAQARRRAAGQAAAGVLVALASVLLQCSEAASVAYPGGAGIRWGHASVIADRTLYVFGGKQSLGNTEADYASPCMALDLSSKFKPEEAVWTTDCARKGPLVADHTAVINADLNMVVMFGGTVPGNDTAAANPVHLFSAEIKFWNTPDNRGFPLALGNHSAVIDPGTGDMVVHGGVFRGNGTLSSTLSNTTMHMVTVPNKHVALQSSPTGVLIIVLPPSTPPPPPPAPTPTKTIAATTTSNTSNTSGSTGASGDEADSSSKAASATSSTRTASRPTATTGSRSNPTPTSAGNTKSSSDDDGGGGGLLGSLLAPLGIHVGQGLLLRRDGSSSGDSSTAGDDGSDGDGEDGNSGPPLMSWTNATQPYGVLGRVGHSSSVVKGGVMVVVGGFSDGKLADMQTLFVYNMTDQVWKKRTAGGRIPPPRRNHAAAVLDETSIVIHGGANADFSAALDDVAVLNTTTWTWSMPDVPKSAGWPGARYAHSAVQAGPYTLLTFGYAPDSSLAVPPGDNGVYILDTSVWQFVGQFDPGRSRLSVLFKSQKIAGGTIFGLLVASLVGLLVLLVLGYIGCTNYFGRRSRSANDETATMLPGAELRDLGRRITSRFKRSASRGQQHPAPARPQMQFLANRTGSSLNVVHAPRLSLTPSHDSLGAALRDSRPASAAGSDLIGEKPGLAPDRSFARLSRRTYLGDVELPAGLRNRDDADAAQPTGQAPPRAHVGDTLAGSHPSLPVAARYRLDDPSEPPALPAARMPLSQHVSSATGSVEMLPPPVGPPVMRPWTADDTGRSTGSGLQRPAGSLRDSLDISTLLPQSHGFFVANPDDS
ncbi:hypothetical protein H4R18_004682 [Coemansia javaensis]|uniref:Galactose oxidase n=1 Tax=Coemansia javaensis TaxID=2761396 RepID=A0A9W8H4Z9_9FUNG|nr:hypothetical protein H4R18_004682 [Coemansia javaensis]